MTKKSQPPGEETKIRCPRLGHQIPFSYCRSENKGLPCFKCLDCWHAYFSVEDTLRRELTPEQWGKVFGKAPNPKLLSLMELMEEAKRRQKKE